MTTRTKVGRGVGGWLVAALLAAAALSGCKKETTAVRVDDSDALTLVGSDVAADGSLTEAGKRKVGDRAGNAALTIRVARARIRDKALEQLAAYPNVRRVEARGSDLSEAAIDKLKRAIPEVEVVK